jgi:uncharacterized protein YcgI (DUF1989 family)
MRPSAIAENDTVQFANTSNVPLSCIAVRCRLWSCFPYMRPLASITHESIQYGIDKDGASVHDVIGSR